MEQSDVGCEDMSYDVQEVHVAEYVECDQIVDESVDCLRNRHRHVEFVFNEILNVNPGGNLFPVASGVKNESSNGEIESGKILTKSHSFALLTFAHLNHFSM